MEPQLSDLFKRAHQFVSILPHSRALGLEVESVEEGVATVRMPYSAALIGDPSSGVIFGGAVSALMDTTAGLSVLVHPAAATMMATLDLRIDYMRAANPAQSILAKAECYHVTHHVAFVRAVAHDDDVDNPVATVSGAFALNRDGSNVA